MSFWEILVWKDDFALAGREKKLLKKPWAF
jgi:hypothetical protein